MKQSENKVNTVNTNNAVLSFIEEVRRRKWTLGLAESCTGGLFSSLITEQAGVSDVYMGAVVSYSNTVKENLLGVSPESLKQYGAVSEVVALEMARGAKCQLGVDLSLAITGVAGPTGGSAEKPVGFVCFAFVGPEFERAMQHQFSGTRREIQTQAVFWIIENVLKQLA